ncbi:MAG: tripartite tricarboxylate transporter permease [Escherichia coli]
MVLSPQILLKIPGTPAAAATAYIDGCELTKQGKSRAGIECRHVLFLFSGGMLSIIVLMFLSPVLASWALKFSASGVLRRWQPSGLEHCCSVSGESPD